MKKMIPVSDIHVPSPKPDETYSMTILDRQICFQGLKQLLGAADIGKAGDRNTGLASADEMIREAARTILSGLTLQHIYDYPLTDDKGRMWIRLCGWDMILIQRFSSPLPP